MANTKKKTTISSPTSREKAQTSNNPTSNSELRKKVSDAVENKAVMNNAIDLLTLKRMYPKRFLSDILKEEGYTQTSINIFSKV
jgi:hypothetical protein